MCEECRRIYGHAPGCPNYEDPPNAHYYCSVCGEVIIDGEEYIENMSGDKRHYECFYGLRELLRWLDFEIKTMNED